MSPRSILLMASSAAVLSLAAWWGMSASRPAFPEAAASAFPESLGVHPSAAPERTLAAREQKTRGVAKAMLPSQPAGVQPAGVQSASGAQDFRPAGVQAPGSPDQQEGAAVAATQEGRGQVAASAGLILRSPPMARITQEEEFDTENPNPDGTPKPLVATKPASLEEQLSKATEDEKVELVSELTGDPKAAESSLATLTRLLASDASLKVRMEALSVISALEPGEKLRTALEIATAPNQALELRILALNIASTHLPSLLPRFLKDASEDIQSEAEFLITDAARSAAERARPPASIQAK